MTKVTQLPVLKGFGDLVEFDPNKSKEKISVFSAAVEHAARMGLWEEGWNAVDWMIEEQRMFVGWWDANVQRAGGDRQSGKHSPRSAQMLSMAKAEADTQIKHQQVSRWRREIPTGEAYRRKIWGAGHYQAMAVNEKQLNQQSLSDEHYTPAVYIEAAREVLGGIDLDPASNETANKTVKAARFLTKNDDGLSREWTGRVWLNPPYGRLVGKFIKKLSDEFLAANVSASVALVNAHCTDAEWFKVLWEGVLCFTDHRINFYGDDRRGGSTHGSVFVYFGPDDEKFVQCFKRFGTCVKAI